MVIEKDGRRLESDVLDINLGYIKKSNSMKSLSVIKNYLFNFHSKP